MSEAFPNRIGVVPRDFLIRSAQRSPGRAIVICCETEPLELPTLCRHFLHLAFDDLTQAQLQEASEDSRIKTMVLPSQTHVQQALEFARKFTDKTIFICCHAGVSRSPAIAWAILYDRTRNLKVATAQLFQVAPYSLPHRDIIRYALEILEADKAEDLYQKADTLLKEREASPAQETSWLNPL